MLKRCVDSLHIQPGISANIFIVESGDFEYKIENTIVIKPEEEFNFNRFLNLGTYVAEETRIGEYILYSNNDVVYQEDCLGQMVLAIEKYDLDSASPWDPKSHDDLFEEDLPIYRGYRPRRYVTGWSFLVKPETIKTIDYFDEQFNFWYADNDYGMTLKLNKLNHALVANAVAQHLHQKSHRLVDKEKYEELTKGSRKKFLAKWKDTDTYKTRFRDPEKFQI